MSRNGRKHSSIAVPRAKKPVLITGGSGFIGTNVAHRFLSAGQPVIIFDNLSGRGVERNLEWLRREHGPLVDVIVADVRDADTLQRVTRDVSRVFHFAAQDAVTASLENPREDFEVNARGTLNLLEALRAIDNPPTLLFASTNTVYGQMTDVRLELAEGRYEPVDAQLREHGISEDRPAQLRSPNGCSKGCAEQYVLDYAQTFDMPTVVFRLSCIYGPHQFGFEDHEWVAHFLAQAQKEQTINIHGNGRQVRDVLFVEDLVDAFLLAQKCIDRISGEVFNLGGGSQNAVSVAELLNLIERLDGKRPHATFDDWRPADQPYYVSDTRKFSNATGWKAKMPAREGLRHLHEWLRESSCNVRRIVDVTELVRDSNPAASSKQILQLPAQAREAKMAKAV